MYSFKLSKDEVILILGGLMELPAKDSMGLILKIDEGCESQDKEAKEAQAEDKKQ